MFEAFIEYLIIQGIPEYSVVLLLFVPIVVAIIAFTRYVIGWRSLSIYPTILMIFALLELAHTQGSNFEFMQGLSLGLTITGGVSLVALALQSATRDMRLHYLSRVGLIMVAATSIIFGMLYFAAELRALNFMLINPLSVIILIMVLDVFIKSYIRKGSKKAFKLIANTIGLSFVIFGLLSTEFARETVLTYPIISFGMIIPITFLGRWRHLRLMEYFRFKDINLKEAHDNERHSQ